MLIRPQLLLFLDIDNRLALGHRLDCARPLGGCNELLWSRNLATYVMRKDQELLFDRVIIYDTLDERMCN
jgi:hypothetical protein